MTREYKYRKRLPFDSAKVTVGKVEYSSPLREVEKALKERGMLDRKSTAYSYVMKSQTSRALHIGGKILYYPKSKILKSIQEWLEVQEAKSTSPDSAEQKLREKLESNPELAKQLLELLEK